MNRSLLTTVVLMWAVIASPGQLAADDTEHKPVLRVVFFTPSDVEPPAGVEQRLKEYVDYAQMFYAKWMKHWNYECSDPLPVDRNPNGDPEVLYVKGRHTEASGAYRQLGFQPEIVQATCRKYKLDPKGQVWWIFIYKGPERRGFRGGGNAQRGGNSTSIYNPNDEGHLRLEDELGSDEQAQIKSKASIHELGHAFGLPHIGPLANDKLGNSLMGPVIRAYRARFPEETRVYLTEASAAMLWKHPLFSGTTKDREVTPTLKLEDFTVKHDQGGDRMVLAGQVVSDYEAHSIVVANESEATRSDYWRKCFAGRIAEDGSFQVAIDELDHTDGQLRIVCCFQNGAVVGQSGGFGLQAGFVKRYRFSDGTFTFVDGWAPRQSAQDRRPSRSRTGFPQRPAAGERAGRGERATMIRNPIDSLQPGGQSVCDPPMLRPYERIVSDLTAAFPKPVSDRMHDAYFVFSFLRTLEQVDQLKSARPLLGEPVAADYGCGRRSRVDDGPQAPEEVTRQLVDYLRGMFVLGHPQTQINVCPSPTIPSIIGGLLPSIYNPNLVSDESSRRVALAEVETVAMTADLLGYDSDKSAGVFTFGGTGTLLYATKIGLEKAFPGTRKKGVAGPAVIVCSDQAHYACLTVANWLGLGEENVIRVPTSEDNEIILDQFEARLREVIEGGRRIACLVATTGTTDAFGLDDLEGMHRVRDRLVQEYGLDYCPHLHADAVIGWAWSVFRDYDFDQNPLGFRHRTVRALAGTNRRIRHLPLADSIGVDFHKTGFTPYVSSAVILKDQEDLGLIARDENSMPYLFQSGNYHPGKFTLETTRSGTGPMAALANLRLFGKAGLRGLLGHLVAMAEELREQLEGHASTTVLNGGNFGPVTLFRVYPDDVDTFTMPEAERTDPGFRDQLKMHNDYNRRIFELVQQDAVQGEAALLSLTDCYRETEYGEPIVALKSYIMSPFCREQHTDAVLQSLWKARSQVVVGGPE